MDVDKFVMALSRHSQSVATGVENAATVPGREVDQVVGVSMNVSKQKKDSVLQPHSMIPDNIARLCDPLCCAGSKAEHASLSNLRENGQLHRGTERENCFGAGHTHQAQR